MGMKFIRKVKPFSVRLWAGIKVGTPDECWPWMKARQNHGHGIMKRTLQSGNVLAHRAVWELINGPIPNGKNVCHKCDNPPCCNPNHLFVGTQADNMSDCSKKERIAKMKLTAENVSVAKKMALSGMGLLQIASDFGVSRSTIDRAISGKTWKHVA